MAMSGEALGAIIGVCGTIVVAGMAYLFAPKKSKPETRKMVIEAEVLTESQQLKKDTFCQEQLEILEKKYKEVQIEIDGYRKTLKELLVKLDETEIKYHKALNTITFLNIELSAYKI